MQLIDDRRFELGFRVAGVLLQAKEFQDERTLEQIGRVFDNLAFAGETANSFFIAAQGKSFVERAADLALQLADAPTVGFGFDLVEAAFVRIADAEQCDVVRPAETEAGEQLRRQSLQNLHPLVSDDVTANPRHRLGFPHPRLGN